MDLSFLRSLVDNPGPFLSVYLDTSGDDRGVAAQVRQARWRDLREELAKESDDTATLDAVGAALSAPEDFGVPGVAAFGTGGRVPLVVKLPSVPRQPHGRWSRLPDLLPLLVQAPPRPPHLLVSANREGGEVLTVGGAGSGDEQQVKGTGWPVHKVKSGGWSQDRYQRSAEEAWATNAKELADAVIKAVSGRKIEAVIVAGDVRARELLVSKLPDGLRRAVVVVDRELPVDSPELSQAAEEILQQLEDDAVRSHLETFHNQAGDGRAVEGLAATVAALRDGQVAELFIGGRYTRRRPEGAGAGLGGQPGLGRPRPGRRRPVRGGAAGAERDRPGPGPAGRGAGPGGGGHRRRAVRGAAGRYVPRGLRTAGRHRRPAAFRGARRLALLSGGGTR